MSLLIAGYPYIKEAYLKTFDYYPEKNVFFLLPTVWKAKGGKLIFKPSNRDNIYKTKALFYHSNYPLIGGLLKGWMPLFPLYLLKIKGLKTVFSPSEPILLTTLYQGLWTKLFGLKHVIFTWENVSYDEKFRGLNRIFKKFLLKLNLFFCDGIICGNKKAAEIIRKFQAPLRQAQSFEQSRETSSKFQVLVCPLSGVDTDFYHKFSADNFLNQYGLTDKFIYTFAGAIGYRKGIHLIVEALGDVVEKIPNVHLVIVGAGEYEENLKFKIENLKLKERVAFINWADESKLREILSASDVFLYPSLSYGGWEEQFGYSMAEASLMELPVISTRTGSIEEVIIDQETGILIEAGNKQHLAGAMKKLGGDSELRKKMGQVGRKYIVENYSYKVIADKFYKFFQKLETGN